MALEARCREVALAIRKRTLANGTTRYLVQVMIDDRDGSGRRKRISRQVRTLREARALEAELTTEASAGAHLAASRQTVARLMEAHLESGQWSPTTVYGYRRLAEREILPAIGTIRLEELRPDRIDRLYQSMRRRGLSNRSVHNVHALLHAAFEKAVRWGWLVANPVDRSTPGPAGAAEGVIAEQDEVERILAAADPQLHLAVRLAAVTGVRRSELCGLQWSDIDFAAGTVKVQRAVVDAAGRKYEKGTKTHGVRIVPLDSETLSLLREQRGIGAIIRWSPRALSQHLADLCDELGISRRIEGSRQQRLGWHSFRHYVGTAIANSGDVTAASRRLGHSRKSTTLDLYVHGDVERDRAAADVMGRLLGERPGGRQELPDGGSRD
jgi:integrase